MNRKISDNYELLKKRQKHFLVAREEVFEAESALDELEEENTFCFTSNVDMELPTAAWCRQFESAGLESAIYIYGIGYYQYLKKFIQTVKFGVAVIYEPDIRQFVKFLCEDVEDVLNQKGVYFITGKERQHLLEKTLRSFLSYNNRKQLQIANIPNYTKRYEEDYEVYCQTIQTRCEDIIFEKNTQYYQEQHLSYNYLNNIFCLIKEAGIQELDDAVAKFNEYPAIIVSAGPSLDKNVKLLKPYKNRVFIVAVEAALNTLQRNYIIPDLIVTLDPFFENVKALEDEEFNRIPMIANTVSGYKLLKKHAGRKFFDVQQENFLGAIANEYHKVLPVLGTGGSVANTAFSFLESAGFHTIILIGQDLAYPNNQAHACDSFKGEAHIDENSSRYYYVDDVYGGKVLTEKNMDLYRLWFEEQIREHKALTVVDATEGGARINGTTIMTLKSALDKYASETATNFVEIINQADFLFSNEEEKEVCEKIIRYYETIDVAIQKLNDGKKLYNRLEELYRQGNCRTKQFEKCVGDIKKLVYYIENDPQMNIFLLYAPKERTAVVDEMMDRKVDDMSEFSIVTKAGVKMLDAYIVAGNRIKEDWQRFVSDKEGEVVHAK